MGGLSVVRFLVVLLAVYYNALLHAMATVSEDKTCAEYFTEPKGEIHWTENDNSSSECSWVISLNTSFGLVVRVEEVYLDNIIKDSDVTPENVISEEPSASKDNTTSSDVLKNEIKLILYEGRYPNPAKMVRVFRGDHPSVTVTKPAGDAFTLRVTLPASVDLVRYHEALIHLTAAETLSGLHGLKEISRRPLSFKVIYNAISMETMPPEVGQGQYNCSPPYEVPDLLKCDVVVQCAGGEDDREDYCGYNYLCGPGRIFFEGECINFHFPSEPMSPQTALQQCQSFAVLYDVVQDPTLFRFIARVTSLSGFDAMVVNIYKVRTKKAALQRLYRFLWQWRGQDRRVIYDQRISRGEDPSLKCSVLRVSLRPHIQAVPCALRARLGHMCTYGLLKPKMEPASNLPQAQRLPSKFPVQKCADGTYTHPFYPCAEPAPPTSSEGHLPRFECDNRVTVHYSLECDGFDDCGDGSDERECEATFKADETLNFFSFFTCDRTTQVVPLRKKCDGSPDCFDGSDEEDCPPCSAGTFYCDGLGCLPDAHRAMNVCPSLGVQADNNGAMYTQTELGIDADWSLDFNGNRRVMVLDLDGFGMAVLKSLDPGTLCDETHVHCNTGFCVPVYMVNNGQVDCPYPYSEERSGERTQCPGYYRCYRHPDICLHDDHLCDGIYHCPLKDDERYCGLTSPPGCTREGLAFTCSQAFPVYFWANYTRLRFLDVSRTNANVDWLVGLDREVGYFRQSVFINFLNVSWCGLNEIKHLPRRIVVLDLSHNNLQGTTFSFFREMTRLRHLNLSHNPLFQPQHMNVSDFLRHTHLASLLSFGAMSTGVDRVEPGSFLSLRQLKELDIRNNTIKNLNQMMFSGLTGLQTMYADDLMLCCIYSSLYPDARMECMAPQDELSSCEDLLRSDFFRGCLWTLSIMALVGNTGVLVYRLFLETKGTSPGFRVLVANLCASDFLMGAYLMMIGCADGAYKGQYLWKQEWWVESTACQAAGFLSLLSSEVSAFIICLITLDRLLVLCFPLSPHLHMKARGTGAACCLCWLLGVALASVPLLADWRFYSHNGICLPLPITRRLFSGHQYAFAVYVVFNLVLFILVGAGQLLIYQSVRSTNLVATSTRSQQDMAIARRLFLIVFSDFCCWFPIGLMGVLATRGTPISGEVNVWAAVFVVPLNSALNPFLYTLNTVLERRRQRKFSQRVELVLRRLDREMTSWSHEQLQDLLRHVQRALLKHSKADDAEGDIIRE